MAWYTLLVLLAGIAIVVYGADEAIKRLLGLSKFFRLSAFVTGVVIAGTLAVLPEMSIGILSALNGTSTFGLGIILGANVADLTLVIGIVVLLAGKQKMTPGMLRNLKISFIAVLLPVILLLDGSISRIDGLILVTSFAVYVIWLLITGRKEKEEAEKIRLTKKVVRLGITVFLLVIGITVLFIGSELVTSSAQTLSTVFGLPLFLMGLVIAIGTCLPEMAFAVRASENNEGEIGIGNILGNVLADSMLTIGVIALIQPIVVPSIASPLIAGVFVAASVIFVYLRSRDGDINKKDAVLLIGVYALFVIIQYLIEIIGI
ncbi:MAG: sodium:calcium antiporter [Candidatus Bathyarchaeota archaeon]|nr:sodium:calcium antiporter [Candidatus Bathyarchaeota archaeon]